MGRRHLGRGGRRRNGTSVVSASELSAEQSALLAGAIINPRLYSPARPNARLLSRQRIILGRMERKHGARGASGGALGYWSLTHCKHYV
jgi:hypothetical protein